ncbi:MAG: hypothetical protein H2069_09475 [Legionella sp.]|nr:hypothetical protein [Legionella sp.]
MKRYPTEQTLSGYSSYTQACLELYEMTDSTDMSSENSLSLRDKYGQLMDKCSDNENLRKFLSFDTSKEKTSFDDTLTAFLIAVYCNISSRMLTAPLTVQDPSLEIGYRKKIERFHEKVRKFLPTRYPGLKALQLLLQQAIYNQDSAYAKKLIAEMYRYAPADAVKSFQEIGEHLNHPTAPYRSLFLGAFLDYIVECPENYPLDGLASIFGQHAETCLTTEERANRFLQVLAHHPQLLMKFDLFPVSFLDQNYSKSFTYRQTIEKIFAKNPPFLRLLQDIQNAEPILSAPDISPSMKQEAKIKLHELFLSISRNDPIDAVEQYDTVRFYYRDCYSENEVQSSPVQTGTKKNTDKFSNVPVCKINLFSTTPLNSEVKNGNDEDENQQKKKGPVINRRYL